MSRRDQQARVPPPPADLSKRQRETWLELAAAVEDSGSYTGPADLPAFRLLARSVALAGAVTVSKKMPATAVVRLYQATAAMLASWGLTPASRAKLFRARASAAWLAERR